MSHSLQGGGSVWCLFHSGDGVGAAPRGSGGNCKHLSGQEDTWGEREGCVFRFPLWDERCNKVFERLASFSPLVLRGRHPGLGNGWEFTWGGCAAGVGWGTPVCVHSAHQLTSLHPCPPPPPPAVSIPLNQCIQSSYYHLPQLFSSKERGRGKSYQNTGSYSNQNLPAEGKGNRTELSPALQLGFLPVPHSFSLFSAHLPRWPSF